MNKIIHSTLSTITIIVSTLLFIYTVSDNKASASAGPEVPIALHSPWAYLETGDTQVLTAGIAKKEIGGEAKLVLAYNESAPAQTIRSREGQVPAIKVVNTSDAVITFKASDGVAVTQTSGDERIKPNGSATYTLSFPKRGVYSYYSVIDGSDDTINELSGVIIVDPGMKQVYLLRI